MQHINAYNAPVAMWGDGRPTVHTTMPVAGPTNIPRGLGATHGALDDILSAFASGKGGEQSQEYLAETLSKAGQKFIVTPEAKAAINKVSINVALPAVAIGLVVGYYLFRKR
tara:strand:+ start:5023 stop:5358 length:336 start_codon:yes stop_codon:yes gene_type:complete